MTEKQKIIIILMFLAVMTWIAISGALWAERQGKIAKGRYQRIDNILQNK